VIKRGRMRFFSGLVKFAFILSLLYILLLPQDIGYVDGLSESFVSDSRADMNYYKNNMEPIVTIYTPVYPPDNITNTAGNIIVFNISVTENDDPPNGSYIANATVHVGALTGIPTQWVAMEYYNHHPFNFNVSRKVGTWILNWTLPNVVQPGIYDIMVNVSDSGNISDSNNHRLFNNSQSLSISIHQENRAPTAMGTRHELEVDEDEDGFFLLDDIFVDEDIDSIPKNTDLDSLTFEFWDGKDWSTTHDFGNYSLAVDSIGNLTMVPDDNWFNIAHPVATPPAEDRIMVRAYDSMDASVSHNVTIKVISMNDAPVIKPIYDWTWNLPAAGVDITKGEFSYDEDELWTIQLMAMDNDTNNPIPDTIQFRSESTPALDSRFDIDPPTGIFNFTPVNTDVGVYSVEINVSDDDGDFELINIIFDIENTNDDPKLKKIIVGSQSKDIVDNEVTLSGTMKATQDIEFNFTVEAADDDIEIGETDSLVFAVAEGPAVSMGVYGKTKWNFSYTPDNDDALRGYFKATITVKDLTGISIDDEVEITVVVNNKNNAPTITRVDGGKPPNDKKLDMGKIKVGEYSNFTIEASDIDNDDLTLDTETPMSYITLTEFEDNKWKVSFKPNTAMVRKNVTVNFSVSDRPLLGLMDYIVIKWTVESAIPPLPDQIPKIEFKTEPGENFMYGDKIVIEGTWSNPNGMDTILIEFEIVYPDGSYSGTFKSKDYLPLGLNLEIHPNGSWIFTLDTNEVTEDALGRYLLIFKAIDTMDGLESDLVNIVIFLNEDGNGNGQHDRRRNDDVQEEEEPMSMGIFAFDIPIILTIISIIIILIAAGIILSKMKTKAREEFVPIKSLEGNNPLICINCGRRMPKDASLCAFCGFFKHQSHEDLSDNIDESITEIQKMEPYEKELLSETEQSPLHQLKNN
jgi:VCBS repeat-containing protein